MRLTCCLAMALELVGVSTRTTGVKPTAVTTPSATTFSSPAATSRIGAPRSTLPSANFSVCFFLRSSRLNGSSLVE